MSVYEIGLLEKLRGAQQIFFPKRGAQVQKVWKALH